MSRRDEAAVFIDAQQRRDVLHGLFTSFYSAIQQHKLVFDTNRTSCTKLPALTQLFPHARMVCCVRDVSWIMDSIERLVRKIAFELSGIFGFEAGNTVYTRPNRVAMSDGMVGYALDAMKEAVYGEHADRLVLVKYEARAPESTLHYLYAALNEEPFDHDFENIGYEADNFDFALGTPGLHTVRHKAEWIERATVLPSDLFARFANDAFWHSPGAAQRGVPMIHMKP